MKFLYLERKNGALSKVNPPVEMDLLEEPIEQAAAS